ncbi:MAG: hypothetical protein ACFFD3_01985 [Candidatus Thorarchaeota archaeon]
MNTRTRFLFLGCVIFILLGLLLVALPRERLLSNEEYTPLQAYPTYYYTSFTVENADSNAVIRINLDVERGGNFSQYSTMWILYQLTQFQFEESFNITEVYNIMHSGDWSENWTVHYFWLGGILGDYILPSGEPIPPSAYVFVFWIEPEDPIMGWSATLTISLQTSILTSSPLIPTSSPLKWLFRSGL